MGYAIGNLSLQPLMVLRVTRMICHPGHTHMHQTPPPPYLPLLFGILMIALGIPLMQDRIRPNPFYGVRTPRTLRDPDAWYRANRVCGRDITTLGGVMLGYFVVSLGWQLNAAISANIFFAIVMVGSIAMSIHSLSAIGRTDLPGAPRPATPIDPSSPHRPPPVRR